MIYPELLIAYASLNDPFGNVPRSIIAPFMYSKACARPLTWPLSFIAMGDVLLFPPQDPSGVIEYKVRTKRRLCRGPVMQPRGRENGSWTTIINSYAR